MNGNDLVVYEQDVDFKKIIEIAFKRQDWGKTFSLFSSDTVKINCTMENFDFPKNKAQFRIECVYPEDEYYNSYPVYEFINFYLDNMTLDEFKRYLLRRIKTLINTIIKDRTKIQAKRKYENEKYYSWRIDDDDIISCGFEDDLSSIRAIIDDDIRNNAYDSLIDKVCEVLNEEYIKLVISFCNNNSNSLPGFLSIVDRVNVLLGDSYE